MLCQFAGEDATHLVLNCDFLKNIREECGHRFRLSFDLNNRCSIWKRARIHSLDSKTNSVLVASICWNIWRKRNNQIFNNVAHTIQTCLDYIYFWCHLLYMIPFRRTRGVYAASPHEREQQGIPPAQQMGSDTNDRMGTSFRRDGWYLFQRAKERGAMLMSCLTFIISMLFVVGLLVCSKELLIVYWTF